MLPSVAYVPIPGNRGTRNRPFGSVKAVIGLSSQTSPHCLPQKTVAE